MTWVPEDEWDRLQQILPISVVDVVLLTHEDPPAVGLISRETPHQGIRWNLVGGRIRFGESIDEALQREISENLGSGIEIQLPDVKNPHVVAQYAPFRKTGFSIDPRKHAVALTYAIRARGSVVPAKEALGFRWFPLDQLPSRGEWGFEQDRAAEECLRSAGFSPEFRS
jgi:ADP-ribose pyrophosphatase YjhB (NUDIX family)